MARITLLGQVVNNRSRSSKAWRSCTTATNLLAAIIVIIERANDPRCELPSQRPLLLLMPEPTASAVAPCCCYRLACKARQIACLSTPSGHLPTRTKRNERTTVSLSGWSGLLVRPTVHSLDDTHVWSTAAADDVGHFSTCCCYRRWQRRRRRWGEPPAQYHQATNEPTNQPDNPV